MARTRCEQTDRQTDGQTDRQGDSYIPPPNFVCGGYNDNQQEERQGAVRTC